MPDHGNPWNLTPRECEVLELCIEGAASHAVGSALGIAPKTVEQHCHSVSKKMRASNRLQAAVLYDRWKRGKPAP